MGRTWSKKMMKEGCLIPGVRVSRAASEGLMAEGKRLNQPPGRVASAILEDWYESVYVPWQREKK